MNRILNLLFVSLSFSTLSGNSVLAQDPHEIGLAWGWGMGSCAILVSIKERNIRAMDQAAFLTSLGYAYNKLLENQADRDSLLRVVGNVSPICQSLIDKNY